MPARRVATKALAELLGALSHPDRVHIIEELRGGELDVNALCERMNLAHSRMSQQLALLRAHRLVTDRREGRHVYYRLANPQLAVWLIEGFTFVESEVKHADAVRVAIGEARQLWREED